MTDKGKNWLIAILGLAGVSMYGYIQQCKGYANGVKATLDAQIKAIEESEDPES